MNLCLLIKENSMHDGTKYNRRESLWQIGGGLGGIALSYLMGIQHANTETYTSRPEFNGGLHHKAKAKRVVQFYMSGGASQVDTFDYKPELIKRNGEPFDPGEKVELFQSEAEQVMQSPWDWKPRGECGKMVSELVPHIGSCADDIAFIHSMIAKSNVHGPATFMQATGFVLPGFPGMGSWVSYGLGSMNNNLPTFVVMPDSRGFAPNGPNNWGSGFLPSSHQGTIINPSNKNPINDLFPSANSFVNSNSEEDGLALLQVLNNQHLAEHEGDANLEARIKSFELAAKMQMSCPEALDISSESEATKKSYGIGEPETEELGRNCLTARRLLERDVRFIQIWSGADNGHPRRNWDSHENLEKDHKDMAVSMDKPIAALIQDLKRQGLFEDTIILWTTEFGRMPCAQWSKGRDHNPFTFTNWLAGGGIQGGVTYGKSDEWSYKAAENPTYCYDVHATVLHLLGINHEKLTYRHNGIDRRLTDVHGHIIKEILA
jgi:hypothetical protein